MNADTALTRKKILVVETNWEKSTETKFSHERSFESW